MTRNLLRRRLREALRLLPLREGFDVVITVRPEAAKASFHTLRTELILLLRRARLLDIPLRASSGQALPNPHQTQGVPE